MVPREEASLRSRLAEMGLGHAGRNGTVVVPVQDSMHALSVLKSIEPLVTSFEVIKGSMDDVFMSVTGHAIRGEEES